MTRKLHVGVMGAGSIGCYVGGRILVGGAADATFVGRARLAAELAEHGLAVKDLDAPAERASPERVQFETEADALASADVVLCAVKSAQTEEVARAMAPVIRPDAVVVSLQNGLRNPQTLRALLPGRTVLAGIVGYNVVSRGAGVFHRTMDGPIVIEASDAPHAKTLFELFGASQLELELREDIAPDQWTKLLVNLNNAVSALSGAPTQQLLASPGYRRVVAALIDEGLTVLRAIGARPAKLRGVPVALMPKVLRLPTFLVRLVTGAQMKVDPEARSSMWEDLTRGRPTEVDDLNGELVRRAESAGLEAPLNRRIVELVHAAERARAGSPGLSAEALWSQLQGP